MTDTKESFFSLAKDIYFERLKLKPKGKKKLDPLQRIDKYQRAAELGLCFHCMREDTNPRHRPLQPQFGLCPECMKEKTIGTEKLDY